MAAQVKPGDDSEVAGARTARRPQPVGVLLGVGMDELAVGGDDVDGDHAQAGRPDHPRQPAPSALQQKAAEPDRRAVAGGEEQAMIGQQPVELAAAYAGLDDRHPRLGVELDPGQP